jgi:hypothetical protein
MYKVAGNHFDIKMVQTDIGVDKTKYNHGR